MKYIVILLMIFLTSACEKSQPRTPYEGNQERQSAVNVVRNKAAFQIKKQLGLQPIGSGGQTSHGVEMLALSFQYNNPISIEEGRKLLIDAVNIFVQIVNSDETIQPYIKIPPFGPQNIEIAIFLRNSDHSDITLGNLCCMSAINANLKYQIDDPTSVRLITIYRESYEEALLKISNAPHSQLSISSINQVSAP